MENEAFYTSVMSAFDILGTVIFAITGAICGVRHRLDFLGVVIFGCTVGVGGGILRDLIIGAVPVAALQHESYLFVCIVTGIAVFFLAPCFRNLRGIITVCDAIGLGVFTALGAAKATSFELHPIGVVLSGVLTAVGGGVIRDVLVRQIPVVLTSDFYATASLLGGILYFVLHRAKVPFFFSFLLVIVFVTGIRLLAVHYRIHLPVAKSGDDEPAPGGESAPDGSARSQKS